ncbi:hypothetical protein K437DRAFT_276679 [Tilletiaria anomala UBC 951]|uniref:G-patch domain-containing protein n=1 Tax=Tilletiaria anomala (strain ATCC 24038 / CBS 436.72 / UBC 951) TaxID=1037660 RepID=A0A066V9Q0_TILAU|nr:uncharacterized protein K437DRAFT_276679 [Tilletiaria anomala UBC 951]KDN37018.1 hypothetical protein K437DRAFT_276679 [Tilletiaria anomala UBC 951]
MAPVAAEEEEDYMSEAFLIRAEAPSKSAARASSSTPTTYSERRRKEVADASARSRIKSRAEREREARDEGLRRNLLEVDAPYAAAHGTPGSEHCAEDTGNKALKMMLAMGYKPGDTLGQRRDLPSTLDLDAPAADRAPNKKVLPALALPVAIDQRWQGRVRHGLGSAEVSLAIQRAAAAKASQTSSAGPTAQVIEDFRARIAAEQALKHTEVLLSKARKSCEELDRKGLRLEYSPLWIDPLWLELSWHEQLDDNRRDILRRAFGTQLDEITCASGVQEATSSLSWQETKVRQALDAERDRPPLKDENEQEDGVNPAPPDGTLECTAAADSGTHDGAELSNVQNQAAEAKAFCSLDPSIRLDITLAHLRKAHAYCLFCGCQYEDLADLEANCPGEREVDHD